MCMRLCVLIAGTNAKFLSSLTRIGRFTVRRVGQREEALDKNISLRTLMWALSVSV